MPKIPAPEAGLVIGYAYLWRHEHLAGLDEGAKDRPSVFVLSVERASDGATIVTVLPITHRPPSITGEAVEIPPLVKRHLGLDDQRSWIVVTEGNEFRWPGYGLRKAAGRDRYDYGFLPPRLFNQVRQAFLAVRPRSAAPTSRD